MAIMEMKLMVVDDDPDILITIRNIFEAEGFEVFTVDSGIDCIKELENGFKGVILMDIMMPFIDGWDTIDEIMKKGYDKDVMIYVLTAKATIDLDEIRNYESLIQDIVKKPFDIKVLISNIRQTIAA
jgi:DNA-binding response OmpR family regulator